MKSLARITWEEINWSNPMKIKVQAQHLQPGDIVGSGEVISRIVITSTQWPITKISVGLYRKLLSGSIVSRNVLWGKYTMINVERKEKE